jgi:SAM-dependent methyltransferase
MLFRKLYYLLSPGLRRFARKVFFLPLDLFESVTGSRPPLVPPKGRIFTGRGNFIQQGDKMLSYFTSFCSLKPDSNVLDVGCGIGRMARPLAGYLSSQGSYEGFDIVTEGIQWCSKAYVNYPNFRFKYISLKNDLYNLSTLQEASEFTFPYSADIFDLIILTSVFTHMQENSVRNYLKEIGRVIRKDKFCFCTFFVITPESLNFLNHQKNPFFKYRFTNYFLHDLKVKDANIAFKYDVIEEMAADAGLMIHSFYPGWWAGLNEKECLDFQDIVILTR